MIEVTTPYDTYKIKFAHYNKDSKFNRNEEDLVEGTECTLSHIREADVYGYMASKMAVLNPKETFCRKKGRMYSLKKTLEAAYPGTRSSNPDNKDIRREFWRAYLFGDC